MPKAGQSMTEGRIVNWLKKEGDAVRRGDPLLEIETDKANLEVEALESGVLLKIIHSAGTVVPVLAAIGVIGNAGDPVDVEALKREHPGEAPASTSAPPSPASASSSAAPAAAATPAATATPATPVSLAATVAPAVAAVHRPPQSAPRPRPSAPAMAEASSSGAVRAAGPASFAVAPAGGRRVFASPLARKVARERGVELDRLQGSGPGGRILRQDVDAAPAGNGASQHRAAPAALGVPSFAYPDPSPRPDARVPYEGMRRAIGTALQQSKQSIPHFYATVPIDMSAALELKAAYAAQGTKVSVNDLIVRASAIALGDEPRVSCRFYADRIEYPEDINIGIAVGTDGGLVVPVVLKAQSRDLAGIAEESRRIVDAATSGKLVGSGQGTFTISNLGMFGVESFTAIINPPEGAILAVGAVRTELVPAAGGFFPRPILRVTLSSDHRAIDGILAARFLARLRHLLESAERL